MNDFITLACPSCGGHLKLDRKTREYTCDYCGQQHRVRSEDIESYGRCPVCKRNDRVEKVSSICNNFSNSPINHSKFAPPVNPIANEPKYLLSWVQEYSVEYKRWLEAIKRWEKTYYCHRDDCVFIINEDGYAGLSDLTNFLYRV